MPFRIREDYKKIDLLLDLINMLRTRRMTKKDIQIYLSKSYGHKISERTVFRRLNEIKKGTTNLSYKMLMALII